jgi:hypothetical protein
MSTINKTLTALAIITFALPAFADTAPEVSGTPISIDSYDTVAYFSVGKAILVVLTTRLFGIGRGGPSQRTPHLPLTSI